MENQSQGQLANLSDQQQQEINRMEKELGVVLIAYDGYRQEDAQGNP
ncbi:MAG TPA: hypothetical protein VFV52_01855 [Bacilli bacterium]|nr:hypothetical protein [Bacilli bacterium]